MKNYALTTHKKATTTWWMATQLSELIKGVSLKATAFFRFWVEPTATALNRSIKCLGLAGLLIGLTACSGAQKISEVPQKPAYHRVPLSESDRAIATTLVNKSMQAIQHSLTKGVARIANNEYVINIEPAAPQPYQIPAALSSGPLLFGTGYGAVMGVTSGSVATALALGTLGLAIGAAGSIAIGSAAILATDPQYNSTTAWPHRFKVVYKAANKNSNEKFEGHCSAYFFDTAHQGTWQGFKTEQQARKEKTTKLYGRYYTRQRKREQKKTATSLVKLHRTGKQITGFTAPFEIDGCTHESIFPESKRGQLRTGADIDATDRFLGQHRVVAYGTMQVKFINIDSQTPGAISELKFVSHKRLPITTKIY